MNGLPYYKRYPKDFLTGTILLPFEVKGAYAIVLDLIYLQGGLLPDDARYIAGNLGVSVRKWNSIRKTLIEHDKLQVTGEFLTNYRSDKEMESLRSFQDKQSENASKPRKNNDLNVAMAQPKVSHTDTDTDTEEKEEKEILFSDFWKVWPNKVQKPNAERAWKKLSAEDRKAVMSLPQAGFADWRKQSPEANAIHPASYLNGRRWEDQPMLKLDGSTKPQIGDRRTLSNGQVQEFDGGASGWVDVG